ncbi:hypothetical protein [Leeia aquatica]|uniref:Uncharacterized protein n=1 Tax=Leeia aquatica TaxID=2725557 RepID=A0A847SDR1_9NEIS|nr:hypothetical protein [Leeia aquatica]NLR76977.1 hypothetical protein [Leeia aquatica]
MKTKKLVFEKIGDIDAAYPYICVYDDIDRDNPFMEIAVNDDKQLQYTLYAGDRNVVLDMNDWVELQSVALAFLPKVLADNVD